MSPFKPEVEQITDDQQRRRLSLESLEEGDERPLALLRGGTDVGIRNDITSGGKHATSLPLSLPFTNSRSSGMLRVREHR
jgi:hypothetical protein